MVCKHRFVNIAQAATYSIANWSGGKAGMSPAVLQCTKCFGVYMVDASKDVDTIRRMRVDENEKKIGLRIPY